MPPIYWLFFLIVFLIIEILTLGLTTIWFAGGCLAAFLAALVGAILPVQLGVFAAVSVLLLVFTRPLATRYFNRNTTRTNVESLVGRIALVTEPVDNRLATGMAQLDGVAWSVRAAREGETFSVGEEVRVESVQGVKLMVSKKTPE